MPLRTARRPYRPSGRPWKWLGAQGGRLIASTSLQGAARAYCRGLADAGLRGEHASHALRYAYARDLFGQYRTLGVEPREARSMLAVDLGHGDGRGRYVAQVYLR